MRGQCSTVVPTSAINSQINAEEFSPKFPQKEKFVHRGIWGHCLPSFSHLKEVSHVGDSGEQDEVQDCNQDGNVGSGTES